jgi:hypothetical protein
MISVAKGPKHRQSRANATIVQDSSASAEPSDVLSTLKTGSQLPNAF